MNYRQAKFYLWISLLRGEGFHVNLNREFPSNNIVSLWIDAPGISSHAKEEQIKALLPEARVTNFTNSGRIVIDSFTPKTI